MKLFSYINRFISDPVIRMGYLSKCGFYKSMSDEQYLKKKYKVMNSEDLNLDSPVTFNEKLNWIKLHDRKELYTRLADKFEVKGFVKDIIGEEYVVPNLGIYNCIEEIDWNELPNQFVLKATHDSSGALICHDKNKLNVKNLKAKYKGILGYNFYYSNREWPYKNIKPRIIVDKYLEDGTAENTRISLRDYKFWCFNGIPKYMYCTVKDKTIYENFYDMDFNSVDIDHGFPRHIPEFEKPKNFDKMIELAGKLAFASQTYFVRVDFFNVDGQIYFGEFTFFDWAGMRPFTNPQQDAMLGKLIQL